MVFLLSSLLSGGKRCKQKKLFPGKSPCDEVDGGKIMGVNRMLKRNASSLVTASLLSRKGPFMLQENAIPGNFVNPAIIFLLLRDVQST